MDRNPIPRINAKGFIVGDQLMRLAFILPVRSPRQDDDMPPSRTELLSDLVALLQRRTLHAGQETLRFLEHRASSLAAMTEAGRESGDLFVPYGLMFTKKWIWEQGGQPQPNLHAPLTRGSSRPGRFPTNACPGRHWIWHGHALMLSTANASVFVPDTIAKAALMAFGMGAWKIDVLENYVGPMSRTCSRAETMLHAMREPGYSPTR